MTVFIHLLDTLSELAANSDYLDQYTSYSVLIEEFQRTYINSISVTTFSANSPQSSPNVQKPKDNCYFHHTFHQRTNVQSI